MGSGPQLDWVIFDGGARDAQSKKAAAQSERLTPAPRCSPTTSATTWPTGAASSHPDRALHEAARALELAKETIELVRNQYEAGTVTQVDLLQAQDGLVGAQESLAQAHFDLAVANLTRRRAAGTFPPK